MRRALLLGLVCAQPAFAQFPSHILDTPFTANWSTTTTENSSTKMYGGVMARASNGSTYTTFRIPTYASPTEPNPTDKLTKPPLARSGKTD